MPRRPIRATSYQGARPVGYFLDLFSPPTYEAFSVSDRTVTGFRKRQLSAAQHVGVGDVLICYVTRVSRWVGLLRVESPAFIDETPIFQENDDPFVVRFKTTPLAWLPMDKGIPIHEDFIWSALSFTKEHDTRSKQWTGSIRRSLSRMNDDDAKLLESAILSQAADGTVYPIDEDQYRRYLTQQVRRPDKTVQVSVPQDEPEDKTEEHPQERESTHYQAMLADVGENMGFRIWLPRNDRARVLQHWSPGDGALLHDLPLNYDETTLKTVEQIDVLWLRRRSIVRAFEVEHTTAVYSGILRMADLLALQPNMDIKLHIVAPDARRDKVFQEIQRPVFSLLEKGPLADYCTFISYDSLDSLAKTPHLGHLSDSVLAEYEEEAG